MTRVDLSRVQKDLYRIPYYIVAKLQRWAKEVESDGIDNMRKIPGFHDEPLKGKWEGFRSIRLNKAYRAIYSENNDGQLTLITIEEVNKHDY